MKGPTFYRMNNLQVSKIYKEQNKYFIACKDGKIYIDLIFDLKNIIKNMFLGE